MEEYRVMRISMSLPKKVLDEFDEVLKERGYQARSKGIRDALKDYILRYQWVNEIEGERIGLITVIYDHHFTGLLEELRDVQYEYKDYIKTVMHVDMTETRSIEAIVVYGDAEFLRKLTENLMGLKGVEKVKFSSILSGEK
jgi:CopG family transcriptional regulator, nickel-responsive regulator